MDYDFSCLAEPDSKEILLDGWQVYWVANLELVRSSNTRPGAADFDETKPVPETRSEQANNYRLVFRHKAAP